MKEGEKFVCSACGETAFAKKETVLDGWTAKGTRLVCPYCGAEAGPEDAPDSASDSTSSKTKAMEGLLNLLGETESATAPDWTETEMRFCRDCAHASANVFRIVCTKTGREVDPIGDCADYRKRSGVPQRD